MSSGDTSGSQADAAERKAAVFVSYSRKDLEFADRLEAGLRARGLQSLIDRAEIYAFEDWWRRIETLIGRADAVVFVLSPDAVASDVCQREVAFAISLNKRLAPIVWRRVDVAAVPEPLRRLNFIFFDDPNSFEPSLDRLAEALSTDIEWVRRHTEFGEHARRWEVAGRPGPRGLLLRSPVLEEAERWIASRPRDAPLPTEATQTFIAESRRAATRRRTILSAGLACGLLAALVLAGAAVWQWRSAEMQRNDALIAQSRFLARDARAATTAGNATLGMLLALAALPKSVADPDRPYVNEAEDALAEAYASRQERLVIAHHSESVYSVAFSPDSRRLVTASDDKTAAVWDVETGARLAELRGHTEHVLFGSFSRDGRRVVTGSSDGTARLWNADTGAEIAVLRGHRTVILAGGFSPDGMRVVTASGDGTARLWNAETGAAVAVLTGHSGQVLAAQFSPDGTRIVTAGRDYTVRFWDAVTGVETMAAKEHERDVTAVTFSPDGSRFVTASQDRTARVWDAGSGTVIAVLRGHEEDLNSAEFSPDGMYVATASRDKTVRVSRADTGALVAFYRLDREVTFAGFAGDATQLVTVSADLALWRVRLSGGGQHVANIRGHHRAGIYFAAIAPNGTRIATVSSDRTVRVWNVGTAAEARVFRGHAGAVMDAALSPDGTRLVTAGAFDDTSIRFWDFATGAMLARRDGHEGWTSHVAFSPDGTRMVTSGYDKIAKLWDPGTFTLIADLPGNEQVRHVAFSPDGKTVVSVDTTMRLWDAANGALIVAMSADDVRWAGYSPDGKRIVTAHGDTTARLWDADSGAELAILSGHEDSVWFAAFSRDGARVVTTSRDKTARIWDGHTGRSIAVLRGHQDTVPSAVFSRDGARVLTAGWDKTARLWDAATGRELIAFSGHLARLDAATFSPDGRRVLTVSDHSQARLWDVETGAEIAMFVGHGGEVKSASFLADGTQVLTASDDGTARLWTIPPRCQSLIDRARAEVPRELWPDERTHYFLTGEREDAAGWTARVARALFSFALPQPRHRCS